MSEDATAAGEAAAEQGPVPDVARVVSSHRFDEGAQRVDQHGVLVRGDADGAAVFSAREAVGVACGGIARGGCAAETRFPVVDESEGNLLSQERLPPRQPDPCLIQRAERQNIGGGTLKGEGMNPVPPSSQPLPSTRDLCVSPELAVLAVLESTLRVPLAGTLEALTPDPDAILAQLIIDRCRELSELVSSYRTALHRPPSWLLDGLRPHLRA